MKKRGSNTTTNREHLLKVSEKAFLSKNFRDVSMRELSEKSGIGLSNIYNYFKNKDEIFDVIVLPATRYIEKLYLKHNDDQHITLDFFYNHTYIDYSVNEMEALILNHKKALQILFFHSKGSRFENFKNRLIEISCEMGAIYFDKMKDKYPDINSDVPPIFVNVVSTMYVNIIENLVAVDTLSKEIIYDVLQTYIEFSTAGWKSIMKVPYNE